MSGSERSLRLGASRTVVALPPPACCPSLALDFITSPQSQCFLKPQDFGKFFSGSSGRTRGCSKHHIQSAAPPQPSTIIRPTPHFSPGSGHSPLPIHMEQKLRLLERFLPHNLHTALGSPFPKKPCHPSKRNQRGAPRRSLSTQHVAPCPQSPTMKTINTHF